MNPLPRIRAGLLRHPLDTQVLVYDSQAEQVHLLDPTTACVLELLEQGGWTSEGITIELAERTGAEPNPGFLPLAIEELRRAGLLDEAVDKISPLPEVTRRDVIRGLALTGAAAVLVPTIATLTATRGYAQDTAGNVAACGPCGTAGLQSSCGPPNTCISGTGGNRCSGGVNPTGQLAGQGGTIVNPVGNCGGGAAATRQNAANAQCCSGSATITQCEANNLTYTCN